MAGGIARKRGLIGLLTADAVSFLGTRMSLVALPWLVFSITGSPAALGLVAFAETAPLAAAKVLAGPAIDRLGPRQVSMWADMISAATVAAIPALHLLGALPLWLLVGLAAVLGTARGPGDSAKMALVPGVTETSGTVLERATGLTGTIDRSTQAVGPPLAGLLVAGFGPVAVIWIDAATFAVAAALIARTIPGRGLGAPDGDRPEGIEAGGTELVHERPGYLGQVRTGFEFLWRERLLRSLVAMTTMTNLIDAAVFSVLLPVWARESGAGPAGMGLVLGAFGAVMTAGSIAAAIVAHRLPRRIIYLVAMVIGGAPRIAVLAVGAPLWLVVTVWASTGVLGGFLNPIISAVIYERIPRPLLGRVLTLGGTATQGGVPIGGLGAGLLVAGIGLLPVALVCAAGYLVVTLLPLRRPEWREMDRRRSGAAQDDERLDSQTEPLAHLASPNGDGSPSGAAHVRPDAVTTRG